MDWRHDDRRTKGKLNGILTKMQLKMKLEFDELSSLKFYSFIKMKAFYLLLKSCIRPKNIKDENKNDSTTDFDRGKVIVGHKRNLEETDVS